MLAYIAEENGMVTRDGFEAAMEYIRGSLQAPTSQHARAMLLLNKLFDLFEPNEADAVDFVELCTGLSVLCAGNREDKVEAAFRLFGACPCFLALTSTQTHTHARTKTVGV